MELCLKKFYAVLILSCFFIFPFCGKPDSENFLKIGFVWFTTDEFFNLIPKHTFKYLPDEEKTMKIEEFIDRQLFVYKGIDDGYLKNPEIRKKMETIKSRLLVNGYFDRVVLDSIITKQLLLSEFERLNSDKKDLFTFDEYAPIIKKQLINKYSDELQSKYYTTIEQLKTDNKFALIEQNIRELSSVYMNLLISSATDSLGLSAIDLLKMTGYSLPLYRINDKDIYLSTLISNLRAYPYTLPDQFSNPEFLSNVVETVAINSFAMQKAKKLKLHKTQDFKKQLIIQKNTLLYNYVFKEEITRNITINDDTLRRFYSSLLDSLYLTKPQYKVQEIFITDKILAESVLKKAMRLENFQHLADKYTERYRNKPIAGYLGNIYADTFAGIGRCAAVTSPGNIHPELIPSGKGFSIIKVISVIEPKPIPFNDIKGKILDDYKKTAVADLKKELLWLLRHKYTYRVNYSLLTK